MLVFCDCICRTKLLVDIGSREDERDEFGCLLAIVENVSRGKIDADR